MKIQADTLRTFKVVHTWTGLLAGLVLFLAFYAGAFTVFREDISVWQAGAPHRLTDEAMQDVTPLVERVITAHPESRSGLMINLPDAHEGGVEAVWRNKERDTFHARLGADGALQLGDAGGQRLSVVIDNLHRTAGIPGLGGELLLGTVAFIYGLALVSGVILYLPVLRRDLFALRIGTNLKLLWQDAHNSIGVLSLPFHILFALTGAVMSLHDPLLVGMNVLIYGEEGKSHLMRTVMPVAMPKPSGEQAPLLPATTLLSTARQQIPDFVPQHLIYLHPGDRAGVVTMMGDQGGVLGHSSRVAMSAVTGEVLAVEVAGARPTGTSALSSLAALHFGDYGGRPVQWLYFCLGMAGAFLFYSGNLMWLEARRKRRAQTAAWHHQALARLTMGVCLGSCVGIPVLFIAVKMGVAGLGVGLMPLFWCTVVLALVWSALRPPVKGARELLAAAAAATAGIPLSSVMAAVTVQSTWRLTGIDLAALAGVLFFSVLARQVGRRARQTTGGSVWDAPASAAPTGKTAGSHSE
ncbi:PepSY-associated TM helix domain-containing protein [Herbaspirillum chlorophenolicum]|uniref:PepSY-associated TM helix domain-containing protein n=1 Tax=Herbaspirillum chlorophenolicum TaxID=211589 RepID=UPI00067BFD04|nr:PepSY-associated TM helix domain-containing protein [Herbaspirillum chlorophenolicum]